MSRKVLDELLGELTDEHKKRFEKHLEYLHPDNQSKLLYEEFEGYKGGVDKLMDMHYHSTKEHIIDNKIAGTKDKKKIISVLEKLILGPMKNLTKKSKMIASVYESTEFESDDEKIQYLTTFAEEHLGINPRDIHMLVEIIKTGDNSQIYAQLRKISDSAKEGILSVSSNEHYIKTLGNLSKEHFNAYAIKKLEDKYKVTPENLGKALLQNQGYEVLRQVLHKDSIDKRDYKKLHLKEYSPGKK